MTHDDPLEICPANQALRALIDAGHFRFEDLTVAEREDIIRQMLLIDQQARERVHEAFRLGLKVASGSNRKSDEAQVPGDTQRKRGRPKGKPLIEKDRSIVREMVVANHLAHLGASSGEASNLTATCDVSNLLQQASQKAFQEASTTTLESIRHRIVSRFRKGEINASDYGLASLHFGEFARAIQSLARGFARKTVRIKNRS